jgi:hypothetical protein
MQTIAQSTAMSQAHEQSATLVEFTPAQTRMAIIRQTEEVFACRVDSMPPYGVLDFLSPTIHGFTLRYAWNGDTNIGIVTVIRVDPYTPICRVLRKLGVYTSSWVNDNGAADAAVAGRLAEVIAAIQGAR